MNEEYPTPNTEENPQSEYAQQTTTEIQNEYAGTEEPEQQAEQTNENILWRGTKYIAHGIYKVAYNMGGFLSDLFGITTPRYGYYLRLHYEMERQRQMQQLIDAGLMDEFGNPIENKEEEEKEA